jgi:hypothetical protein
MAELKTRPNDNSVKVYLNSIEESKRRQDCQIIMEMMQEITQCQPKMWGSSIVGFGNYHYKYASGREGDWFLTGLSSRKQSLTLYIMCGFEKDEQLLSQLGQYKMGKSCFYIKNIEDINLNILRKLIEKSVEHLKKVYPA